ncbi:hypothetical protein [Chryseobacterium sp. 2987]|uniref:hypothetical protein n=1 Tax=Chryseobacterium sp. 2987 TaxID=2817767 RepID=UPI00286BEBF1|nr:hypothetical protein [Chryseobacterium sp. 2987]
MKNFILATSCLILSSNIFGQVGINTSTPDISSILEIRSTNKGIKIPKVQLTSVTVKAQVAQVADGLIIFNTAENLTSVPILHKGLHVWSEASQRWEYLISKTKLTEITDGFGIELAQVASNQTTPQAFTATLSELTFSSTLLNYMSAFTTGTDSYYTAPVKGRYYAKCGMVINASTSAQIQIRVYNASGTEDTGKRQTFVMTRDNIVGGLTVNGTVYLELNANEQIRCWGSSTGNASSTSKYFYLTKS